MACFHPLGGWPNKDGTIGFKSDGRLGPPPVRIACGQCSGCRLERSRQWAVRCVHEAQMHDQNCFITLTYDNAHLPQGASLEVKHWQNFAKKLRRRMGPFRFFHCGEYGDNTNRPHYHAVLFGLDFIHDRIKLKESKGFQLYESATLTEAWEHGFANIGAFSFETAAYVARYVMKKRNGDHANRISPETGLSHYQRVDTSTGEVFDVKPEYTTMSRRPGIGASWFDQFGSDVFPSDEVITNGKRATPPRYYTERHRDNNPKEAERIRISRINKAKKHASDNTPERLRVREVIHKQKLNQYNRDNI